MKMHQHPPVQRSEAHQVQLSHNRKELIYMSSFTINNITYKTSKHFIQLAKAKHYGDSKTEITILICETALEAKRMGQQITKSNGVHDWNEVAKEVCAPGIEEKFCQNTHPILLFEK